MEQVTASVVKNEDQGGSVVAPYRPGKLTSAAMWFVGAATPENGRKEDYDRAKLIAPLLLATSGLAGFAAALAMNQFMGVTPPFAAVGGLCTTFLYAAMDRTIIGLESRAKALRKANKDVFPENKNYLGMLGHVIGMGSRIGLAVCFGLVVTKVVMTTQLYQSEIATILEDRYQSSNADIINYYDAQRESYDRTTKALKEQIAKVTAEWAERRQDSTVADAEQFDDSVLQGARQRLLRQQEEQRRLQEEIASHEREKNLAARNMAAEEEGIRLGGSTGVAGRGPEWREAQILYQTAENNIASVQALLDATNTNIEMTVSEIKALEKQKEKKSTVMGENASEMEQLLADLEEQLKSREQGREQFFADLDRQMRDEPNHSEPEAGLLASLSALDELLSKPENQGTPQILYYALLLLLIGLETSPVISAAMRPSTRAELLSAYRELRDTTEESVATRQRLMILRKAIQEETEYLAQNNVVDRKMPAHIAADHGYARPIGPVAS